LADSFYSLRLGTTPLLLQLLCMRLTQLDGWLAATITSSLLEVQHAYQHALLYSHMWLVVYPVALLYSHGVCQWLLVYLVAALPAASCRAQQRVVPGAESALATTH
jgi:hypothetical protein